MSFPRAYCALVHAVIVTFAFVATYALYETSPGIPFGAVDDALVRRQLEATKNCSCDTEAEEKETIRIVLEWTAIVLLITMSGLFSGLTLGLMGLDKIGLEIVMGGDPTSDDAKYAKKIYPIRCKGNLLLCTLLLGNVMVNAALSILLADYTGGTMGFILSTAVIVIFGEIGPQASCSRHALYIGAKTVWLVKVFVVVLFPITKPISLTLDWMLGEEVGAIYNSGQMKKLLQVHVEHNALDENQAKIMQGAMGYMDKTVSSVMTPVENIFMLDVDTVLDFKTISLIFRSGYSRVPVFQTTKNKIVGLLLTKDLIMIDPEEGTTVRAMIQFFGRKVQWLWPDNKLSQALAMFKSGRTHMAMVHDVNNESEDKDPFYEVRGIVTLEDIIEEILQDEIVDETDLFVEVEKETRVDRESFDYARLRLLDSRHQNELSDDEVNAVTAHLSSNVSIIVQAIEAGEIKKENLKMAVKHTPVLELKGPNFQGSGHQSAKTGDEAVLYRRGKPETHCTLILSGKMQIVAGREEFRSEAGPWSILGEHALNADEGSYVSDFRASPLGDVVRCLRFSRTALFRDPVKHKPVRATRSRVSVANEASAGDSPVSIKIHMETEADGK